MNDYGDGDVDANERMVTVLKINGERVMWYSVGQCTKTKEILFNQPMSQELILL